MRKSSLVSILAAALAVNLGGCVSLLPKTKPAQLYRFGADESAAPAAIDSTSGPAKVGVVLGAIGFPRASTSDGILTVTGDETAYIGGVRWVAPARTLFQEAVQREFERHAKQAQIVNVGDVGPAGAILRLDVSAFEARYRRPGQTPVVVVALTARLARSDGRLLDQRDFSISTPARANSITMIVKAFDQATDQVLTEASSWTDAEVAGMAAPGSTPPVTVTMSTSSTSTTTTTQPH